MTSDITKKIIDQIKDEKISPESVFLVRLRKTAVWTFVVVSILAGSVAVSAISFVIRNSEYDLVQRFGSAFFFESMPYFWLIFLAVFLFVGDYIYDKTTFGHRYGVAKIAGVYIISTVLIGTTFVSLGSDRLFENEIREDSLMRGMIFNHTLVWSQPENGFLSGRIRDLSTSTLILVDFSGKEWLVNIDNTLIRKPVRMIEGEYIKLIGKNSDDTFDAEDIRPWVRNTHNFMMMPEQVR